jgi:hypothetical protein
MPDVSGIPAVDVLIGLFFLYFVLSLACSALNELIAQLINLRARTLEAGVRNLLGDEELAKDFFDHPRLRALSKPAGRILRARGPSYIPSRVFALTLLDTLAPPPADRETNRDLAPRARKALKDADVPERVKTMLRDALDEGGARRDRFRAELERSFDEGMDRVSGWYKRRTQMILLVIALGVVGVTNADSFVIAQRLWKDDALRGAVAAQAAAVVESGGQDCPGADPEASPPERAAACVDAVAKLGIPLGWTEATSPDGGAGLLAKLGGLLLTALMLSLGASFWFDLLSKVARLRASGPPGPPKETRDADRPAEGDVKETAEV